MLPGVTKASTQVGVRRFEGFPLVSSTFVEGDAHGQLASPIKQDYRRVPPHHALVRNPRAGLGQKETKAHETNGCGRVHRFILGIGLAHVRFIPVSEVGLAGLWLAQL